MVKFNMREFILIIPVVHSYSKLSFPIPSFVYIYVFTYCYSNFELWPV